MAWRKHLDRIKKKKKQVCGVTQIPTLASHHVFQFHAKWRDEQCFHFQVSFCFVATLSKCMSLPPYFGWSFDFCSALISTGAQNPWVITHHSRALIRFLLISVPVLSTIMVSLCSIFANFCKAAPPNRTQNPSSTSCLLLVPAEIESYQSSSRSHRM